MKKIILLCYFCEIIQLRRGYRPPFQKVETNEFNPFYYSSQICQKELRNWMLLTLQINESIGHLDLQWLKCINFVSIADRRAPRMSGYVLWQRIRRL